VLPVDALQEEVQDHIDQPGYPVDEIVLLLAPGAGN